MKYKLGLLLLITSVVVLFLYFYLRNSLYEKNIYICSINSKIIKVDYKKRGGYIYYYSESNSFWGSSFSDSKVNILNINDSVSKKSNSLELKIFKKLNGKYVYYKTYKGER